MNHQTTSTSSPIEAVEASESVPQNNSNVDRPIIIRTHLVPQPHQEEPTPHSFTTNPTESTARARENLAEAFSSCRPGPEVTWIGDGWINKELGTLASVKRSELANSSTLPETFDTAFRLASAIIGMLVETTPLSSFNKN